MARLTAAFASSHSIMLAATLDDWLHGFRTRDHRLPFFDHEGRPMKYEQVLAAAPADADRHITPEVITTRFHEVQAAMAHVARAVAAARLDVLVIVGDDQYELFDDAMMPAIGIYYGDTIRNAQREPVEPGDWYKAARMRRLEEAGDAHYACHPELALHLIDACVEREFDICALSGLTGDQYEGHAYSFVHQWYLRGLPVPVVPIFVNTYNPPNPPTPRRCVRFGQALRAAIASYPEDLRVGVMASGGLSHFVVEETMDRGILEAIGAKDLDWLAALDPRRLKSGSSEIRNWIIVAAAATDLDLAWTSYSPGYRTPALTGTGLGFACWVGA